MYKLKIEEKEYNLPSSWEEVNIEMYIKLQSAITEEISGIKQIITFISILSECPLDVLYNVSIDDLGQIDLSWIGQEIKPEIKNIIEIDGKRYGMVS